MKSKIVYRIALIMIFVLGCSGEEHQKKEKQKENKGRFIQPPSSDQYSRIPQGILPQAKFLKKSLYQFEDISHDSICLLARNSNKPVILYFTGHAMVNGRKLEEEVKREKRLFQFFNDFTTIALNTDENLKRTKDSKNSIGEENGALFKHYFPYEEPAFRLILLDSNCRMVKSSTDHDCDQILLFFESELYYQ